MPRHLRAGKPKFRLMRKIFFIALGLILFGDLFAQDTTQKIIYDQFNSAEQQSKPYVILISADGFRWDFAKKYHAENILRLSSEGITASSMIPCFPSLTFPNHYSIATGVYPAHHGLINNSFYDEQKQAFYSMNNKTAVIDNSWYDGTTL